MSGRRPELQPTVFCEFAGIAQRNEWWAAQQLLGGVLRGSTMLVEPGVYRLASGGYARVYCEKVWLTLSAGEPVPRGFVPLEEPRLAEVDQVCLSCGRPLPAGSRIRWDSAYRQARCAEPCEGWPGMIA